MFLFVYRCPATGKHVQGSFADDLPEGDAEAEVYESVVCLACSRMHFINRSTHRVLGDEGDG
jgi:hypothetical protein